MENIFLNAIHYVSLFIAGLGVLIILTGAIRSVWEYFSKVGEDFTHTRSILGSHLVLGLDFFIGVDVIETLLLDKNNNGDIWKDLASLVIVVAIRIVVNHFLLMELSELEKKTRKRKK